MNKGYVFSAIGMMAVACWAGKPTVSNVRAVQREDLSKIVDVYYDVSDPDGDMLTITAGISEPFDINHMPTIPNPAHDGINMASATGDIGAGVTPGANKHIVWNAGADYSERWSDKLRVWVAASDAPSAPPDLYLVIDLSAGTNAVSYPVEQLSAPPAGGWTMLHKTERLVLRKVMAGEFLMGSPTNELGRTADETQHRVVLSHDFHIGVFEVTQRQWELVMGTRPSYFTNDAWYAARPVEQVSFVDIRTSTDWPASNAVGINSFMGRLRAKAGLDTLDLPTEAQWEYACRAGTTTALNTDTNLLIVSNGTQRNDLLDPVGRYNANSWAPASSSSGQDAGTSVVGMYIPNAWGLYDMHGNVSEWCLDRSLDYPIDEVWDPVGGDSSEIRISRGGGWNGYAAHMRLRSAARDVIGVVYGKNENARNNALGFRVTRTFSAVNPVQ